MLQAYITICDMLVDFCRHLASNPVMEPLVYEPDKNVQGQLSGFLNDKVFVEEEDGTSCSQWLYIVFINFTI